MIRDTDQTQAPWGVTGSPTPGKAALPMGTEAPSSPIRSLYARRDSVPNRRPSRLGFFPAGRLTAAVTTAPRTMRRPAQPVGFRQPRPSPGPGLPAVAPYRSCPGCNCGDCLSKSPPALPAVGGSGRGRSPPPPPACSPLPPAPPPPSPAAAAAAAAAAGSVTSAPTGPSLPH